jgi:hypothetical protein
MKIKETLRTMAFLFCNLYTSTLLTVSLLNVIWGGESTFDAWDLLKTALVVIAGVTPTFMFAFIESASKTVYRLLTLLHFILTGAAVFGLLVLFGWVETQNAIGTGLVYVIVYIVNTLLVNARDKSLADKLNEKINAFHNSKNATYGD